MASVAGKHPSISSVLYFKLNRLEIEHELVLAANIFRSQCVWGARKMERGHEETWEAAPRECQKPDRISVSETRDLTCCLPFCNYRNGSWIDVSVTESAKDLF